jgi:hypothetical protein
MLSRASPFHVGMLLVQGQCRIPESGSVELVTGKEREEASNRSSQRASVANCQNIEAIARGSVSLHQLDQPVTAPLGHGFVAADVFGSDLSAILYQVLCYLAGVISRVQGCLEGECKTSRGSTEIDSSRTGGEEEIEYGGDVRFESFR